MCRIYKKSGNFRKEIYRCDTQSENHGKRPVFSICFVFEMTWDETEYHKTMYCSIVNRESYGKDINSEIILQIFLPENGLRRRSGTYSEETVLLT